MQKNFYNNFEEGVYFETTTKVQINANIKFLGEYFHLVLGKLFGQANEPDEWTLWGFK